MSFGKLFQFFGQKPESPSEGEAALQTKPSHQPLGTEPAKTTSKTQAQAEPSSKAAPTVQPSTVPSVAPPSTGALPTFKYSVNLSGLNVAMGTSPATKAASPSKTPVQETSAPSHEDASAQALFQQAMALHQRGQLSEAKTAYEALLKAHPDHADGLNLMGVLAYQTKDLDQAVRLMSKARELNPNHAGIQTNLGNVLKAMKRFAEARDCYQQAISLQPNDSIAYNNLGTVLNELKQHREALACFDRALAMKPNDAVIHYNKGNALFGLSEDQAAVESYEKSLELAPNDAKCHFNHANALARLKRFKEAVRSYDLAVKLDPNMDFLLGMRLIARRQLCDWSNLQADITLISQQISQNKRVAQPFYVMSSISDPALQKKATEIYVEANFPANPALGPLPAPVRKDKIRLAYFSNDFCDHPVSVLTAQLYEMHDRSRFEVIAISYKREPKSAMQQRLKTAFDQFIDVDGKTDEEIARLSRELGIDIAVDLGGLTYGARTKIFALRAAPVQVNYIGFPATMGAPYMDYIIADHVVVPHDLRQYYTEKVVHLPCYQVNDTTRAISEKVFTRAELGLPEKGFVFCSFNQTFKLSPDDFKIWMEILASVKDSVLLLMVSDELVCENLRNEARACGIDASRLVFCGRLSPEEYLARYKVCDLFLDSHPCNAGTTGSDALWAGVPLITMVGQSFAGRMAAALLTGIGLPELITESPQAYKELAIELATDPRKLEAVKEKLTHNRSTTALFDTKLFAQSIEKAYSAMYERHLAGMPPDHISI